VTATGTLDRRRRPGRCPKPASAPPAVWRPLPSGPPGPGTLTGVGVRAGLAQVRVGGVCSGQYTDNESGLVYLRARYYDPGTGVFLTRDPLEAQTREAYGYVGGNPLNFTDPSGLYWGQGLVNTLVPDCPFGKNPNGSCRGSNVENDLKYGAVVLGGTALLVGTAGLAAPGLTVLGVSAGTASFALAGGSTAASLGVAYLDCRNGITANCAASSAEALGGAVTMGMGGFAITATMPLARFGAGLLGLGFDVAAFVDAEPC